MIPQSQGGADHLDNLQPLCGACNSLRSNGDLTRLMAQLHACGHMAEA